MSSTQSAPPPREATLQERARNYFGIALAGSLVIHFALGSFFVNYKPPKPEKQVVEKVDVTKRIKVVVPTPPPPTPTPPPPTPPPKQTPPPPKVTTTNPPPVKKLKLDVVKTHNTTKSTTSENTYVAPAHGDENGVPRGNAATGAPAVVATNAPAAPTAPPPPPTVAPTLKPTCAVPNQQASVVNKVDPDYPDGARAQGATGTTRVQVNLSATGGVSSVSVSASSGNNLLDQAALAAARQSTYQPEIVNCEKSAQSYIFVATFDAQ